MENTTSVASTPEPTQQRLVKWQRKKREPASPAAPSSAKKTWGSKTDFIRSQPLSLGGDAVVAAGKALGLSFARQLVYTVRARDAKQRARPARTSPTVARAVSPPTRSAEAVLRAVALELGIGRAIEIVEAERERVVRLLG